MGTIFQFVTTDHFIGESDQGKAMVNGSLSVFDYDGDEPLAGEWEVVEEDRPPIYHTDAGEEQLLMFDLYNDEDNNPIFDISNIDLICQLICSCWSHCQWMPLPPPTP